MMLWFGWISPAGVLLYWVTSSMLGVAQQQLHERLQEGLGLFRVVEVGDIAQRRGR